MAQALIVADPNIMMGKPTVAGTRITVEMIREKLAAPETVDQILAAVLGAEVVHPTEYVRA